MSYLLFLSETQTRRLVNAYSPTMGLARICLEFSYNMILPVLGLYTLGAI